MQGKDFIIKNESYNTRFEVMIIKTGTVENSRNLIIELARSLGVDFPKDKTCKDCFHYNQDSCWEEHKVTIRPCDPDDMSHLDYTDPYKIKSFEEAVDCTYYQSGLEEYKRLYNQSKQELDNLKKNIIKLCK